MKRNILFNPGPSTTSLSVKNALVVPDVCHREEEFQNLTKSIRRDLVRIVGNTYEYTAVLFSGSGTASMESVMCSLVPEITENGDLPKKALIISNGLYGSRFVEIAESNVIPFEEIRYKWGTKIDLEYVKKVLELEDIGSVFVTHHETTTGILNDIESIGKIVKKRNIPYVVDTISSYAGIPISMDDVGADFIMSTSNKCIQGMPGISFVICRKSELEKCNNNRTLYLDLYKQYELLEEKSQFRFTPPVQVMYSLRQAIDELQEEGIINRRDRYKKSMKTLVNGLKELGIKQFLSDKVEHSHILETFYIPEWMNFKCFHDEMFEKGYTVYSGLLQEKTFRLSVIGDIDYHDILKFLVEVKKFKDKCI